MEDDLEIFFSLVFFNFHFEGLDSILWRSRDFFFNVTNKIVELRNGKLFREISISAI